MAVSSAAWSSFFGFITGVSLLFLFFGKQLQDALAFGFIRSLLKQQAVMFYVLAPDETEQGLVSIGPPTPDNCKP
jgi:hypothetical protein